MRRKKETNFQKHLHLLKEISVKYLILNKMSRIMRGYQSEFFFLFGLDDTFFNPKQYFLKLGNKSFCIS